MVEDRNAGVDGTPRNAGGLSGTVSVSSATSVSAYMQCLVCRVGTYESWTFVQRMKFGPCRLDQRVSSRAILPD